MRSRALATTPITVAISRHENRDALLLCCAAALCSSQTGASAGLEQPLRLLGPSRRSP